MTDTMKQFFTKSFKNGDKVKVCRLGNSAPGEYLGYISGIYGPKPIESYIVEMIDGIPGNDANWSSAVFSKGCIDLVMSVEEQKDSLPRMTEEELLRGLEICDALSQLKPDILDDLIDEDEKLIDEY